MNYYIKTTFCTMVILLMGIYCSGQVGIGTQSPKGVLDVNNRDMSKAKGIVLPKADNPSDIKNPEGNDAVEGTYFYDLTEKCTKFKRADAWSTCLLDDAGVRSEVANILSVGTEFKVRKASAGLRHTLLMGYDDYSLYVAGDNSNARTGLGRTSGNTGSFLLTYASPLADISAGELHSIIATQSGEVYTFGYNNVYRTGLGTNAGNTGLPTKVDVFGDGASFGKAVKVAAGSVNSYVLTESGIVYSVGGNTNGSSGTGAALTSFTALSFNGATIADISASQYTAAALTTDGRVFVWGAGADGRLGNGGVANALVPTEITLPGMKQVEMGFRNGIAISTDGKHVYRWGFGTSVANGSVNLTIPTELAIPDFDASTDEIYSVAAQRFNYGTGNLFIFTSKGVFVTGENRQGQLGIGTTTSNTSSLVPMLTTGVYQGTQFTGGSVGQQHTILLTGENQGNVNVSYVAYGMGAVSFRQLGAITVQRRVPTVITK